MVQSTLEDYFNRDSKQAHDQSNAIQFSTPHLEYKSNRINFKNLMKVPIKQCPVGIQMVKHPQCVYNLISIIFKQLNMPWEINVINFLILSTHIQLCASNIFVLLILRIAIYN